MNLGRAQRLGAVGVGVASHAWRREIYRARSKSQLPSREQMIKGVQALKIELSKCSKVALRQVLCRSGSARSCCYMVMNLHCSDGMTK